MNKPKLTTEPLPSKLPLGPAARSGILYEISAGMRTFRPVIDTEKCVKCLQCFLCCPDGVIDKSGEVLEIDYDYCKGCGVCKNVCSVDAITMIKEEDA
ncbi:MAG: 4Fe-4S binding protein [Anaerovoracaceae bacterium]|nr:4Fe-4S binding protein [Anaerovoracaceae bacterium]